MTKAELETMVLVLTEEKAQLKSDNRLNMIQTQHAVEKARVAQETVNTCCFYASQIDKLIDLVVSKETVAPIAVAE